MMMLMMFADSNSAHSMSAEAAEAGAYQRLPADGRGVH